VVFGLDQLNGSQRKILRLVILSAFPREGMFDIFLSDSLNKRPLSTSVGALPYEHQIFKLIEDAEAEGWTVDLIAALQTERPRNSLVRNLADALRMATNEAAPGPNAAERTLEKIVRGAGFDDLLPWAEKLTGIGQATCRIEFPADGGVGYGTGFLVADDLVLTNYHVVEEHIGGTRNPADIRCRFDYARDARGLEEGRLVSLAAGESWIVVQSPYDPADVSGVGRPASDRLDFALLRLSERAGAQDMPGGGKRGVVTVPLGVSAPNATAPVFIVQHPEGRPMAMAIGIVLAATQQADLRLRYDADTLPGSSGSGVFDQKLQLVALHHAGDPRSKMSARYNEGIPIDKIVAYLANTGVAPFWRDARTSKSTIFEHISPDPEGLSKSTLSEPPERHSYSVGGKRSKDLVSIAEVKTPDEIVYFERLWLFSIALGIISAAVKYAENLAASISITVIAGTALALVLQLLLILSVSRGRKRWASWIIVVLFAVGLPIYVFALAHTINQNPVAAGLSGIQYLMQTVGLYFLFQPAARHWLAGTSEVKSPGS
jgi:hypothetical protein